MTHHFDLSSTKCLGRFQSPIPPVSHTSIQESSLSCSLTLQGSGLCSLPCLCSRAVSCLSDTAETGPAVSTVSLQQFPMLLFRCRLMLPMWSMFVFLMMPTLYLYGRLTGFAKATKTCPAHKLYWRPLNWKRSLPVLKWTSESEYFLSFGFFLQTLYI